MANTAELIISEYIEGSGNNEALGFCNSGGQILNSPAYRVRLYFNGTSAVGRSIDLSDNLTPDKTFVLANDMADLALLIPAN